MKKKKLPYDFLIQVNYGSKWYLVKTANFISPNRSKIWRIMKNAIYNNRYITGIRYETTLF